MFLPPLQKSWRIQLLLLRTALRRSAVLFLVCCLGLSLDAVENHQVSGEFLKQYCLSCHSTAKKKGDVDLENLPAPGVNADSDHRWDAIRQVLAEQEMPPSNKSQPTQPERDRIISWIDQLFDGPNGGLPTDPGWVSAHRLTRNEYNRTIQDLLGVGGNPADLFPAENDGGSGSFDNNSDTLYVSPLLMERLLDLSLSLVIKAKPERLGIVTPTASPDGTGRVESERRAAEQSLVTFLPRAWRRPVRDDEIQAQLAIYTQGIERSRLNHQDALRLCHAAALTSPNFLFRIEHSQEGNQPYALNPYEIANRLSYFLWSSMPDETLFQAAKNGSLNNPKDISAQVTRLLAHSQSQVLPKQFMGQWLGTDDLTRGFGPDEQFFKKAYDHKLRNAMIEEPVVFMRELIKNNGSLTDLIDCNYVFVNDLLAKHYGLPEQKDSKFVRFEIANGERGGLISMAGVLAITSRPARTSPVIRGKWILQELLSYPPPPPPPNVPPLPETKNDKKDLSTLRQRLERHRSDPACNGCHQRIDPLGFGLENYDAIGRWRKIGEHGEALDTVGTLPNGETFDGPQQLKKLLVARQDRIMQTVVERLLSYALSRGLERHDRATVRQITKNIAADGYRAQTLIREIALSLPFRYKRNPTIATSPTSQTTN